MNGTNGMYELPLAMVVIDDNSTEIKLQSFAVMAQIGHGIEDAVACFMTPGGEECIGRTGATVVTIRDNDSKCLMYAFFLGLMTCYLCHLYLTSTYGVQYTYHYQ